MKLPSHDQQSGPIKSELLYTWWRSKDPLEEVPSHKLATMKAGDGSMKAYDETTYGARIATAHDDLYLDFEPAAIDLLAELAGERPALELGIGTGRIALPLGKRDMTVYGVDASAEMLARLESKPQGAEVETITGSFVEFKNERQFSLIYVVFNTFFALHTQEEQVRCFQTVAEHIAPQGVFLIDAFVPNLGRFDDHQTMRAIMVTEDTVQLEVSQVDPVTQQVTSQHVFHSKDGTRMVPVKLRYAGPAELDLMAQLAGLSLRDRWGSWERDAFTEHVISTYRFMVRGSKSLSGNPGSIKSSLTRARPAQIGMPSCGCLR